MFVSENVTAVQCGMRVSEPRVGPFRDVSSVELLMNNHQGIKAEIDARNDSFTTCIELGKSLLARKHYASEEVRCLPQEWEPQCRWPGGLLTAGEACAL